MLPLKMSINKKLLPIKGHFFLFNAGTAPLVPYLSTYARQLGFSSVTVGFIYTVLPIFGLIAKPLFGVIADKYKKQKSLFIIFQIVTIISFGAIYFIPESRSGYTVDLDCNGGVTMLRGCYSSSEEVDHCKISTLSEDSNIALCDMECDMSSPKMWQTVCEHWQIPQYCYSHTGSIQYSTNLTKVTLAEDNCANISTSNVVLDGYSFVPHCRVGEGYVDINEPCKLICSNEKYYKAISNHTANMTCVNEMLNYRVCLSNMSLVTAVTALSNDAETSECEASCNLDETEPWKLMEICDGWNADVTESCQPKTNKGDIFPSTLNFVGTVIPNSVIDEHECVHVKLKHITMPDGSTHYPNCIDKSLYQIKGELFHTTCQIKNCNNTVLNEIFQATSDIRDTSTEYSMQFWLFFLLMIISWIGQAVVVTFADAICFNILGNEVSKYGKQRLWGSVGWGIFSLLTGTLIDVFSDGAVKNYAVAFILMFVFMVGDVLVSCFIKNESSKMSLNILADVGTLLSSLSTFIFVLWTIAVGLSTGLLWQFLFWHLEDIAEQNCGGVDYIKTLQGLVSAIQTFGGEIPFMFLSGYILKKLGHVNMMSLVLCSFGIRFVLYSLLTNPWWVLPIEMLQGITFGMFYPTLTSYANVVSPPGTETTVQGLVGAVFEGVGVSLGSLIGGHLYETYGGWITFRWFGIFSVIFGFLHIVVQHVFRERIARSRTQGYLSVIRYEQPSDMVFILEDMTHIRS